jgi:hypothetical protein
MKKIIILAVLLGIAAFAISQRSKSGDIDFE